MGRNNPSREDDIRLLNILDMAEKGMNPRATVLERYGLSNSALSGIMNRYRDSWRPCACVKPENRDGGMPDRWWAK